MHAVAVRVSISDREKAQQQLQNDVIPRVKGAPGFVAGYWVALESGHGNSIAVFESEEAARAVADRVREMTREGVNVESVDVGEVVAHA